VTNPAGGVTQYTYDSQHRMTAITRETVSYQYDVLGRRREAGQPVDALDARSDHREDETAFITRVAAPW
jgi:uncharacterized protein RhaS with RHS repeats